MKITTMPAFIETGQIDMNIGAHTGHIANTTDTGQTALIAT